MVEADADLEDALIEEADPPRLLHPGLLEVLVALVELALVELLYALEGEVRQPFGRTLSCHPPLAAAAASTTAAPASACHAGIHNRVRGEGGGAGGYRG